MKFEQATTSDPLPPGSFGFPIIGETLSLLTDRDFAQKRHQKYGDIFKTRIFGQPTVSIRGSEGNLFVLSNENTYFATFLPPTARALFGSSALAVQTGAAHLSRRKLLYQAFVPRTLAEYIPTVQEITRRYLQKWEGMETLTWYPELQNYGFDLACKFMAGIDLASSLPLSSMFEIWEAGLFSIPVRLPWTKFGRAKRCRQQLLAEIEKIIRQRQQQPDVGSDVLAVLLQARDSDGKPLSNDEVKNQLLGLLFAGHGTLPSALASFCLLSAQHKEVLARIRAEQTQFAYPLTVDSLKQMTYLELVLKEVLRMIPPVGGGFRRVIRDCSFGGYHIPKGWLVIYQISLTHQDSNVYFEPERFDPERFNPQRAEDKKTPFGYVPFGGGLRECLGKELARLEMKVFVAMLVRHYEWELLPNQDLKMDLIPIPRPRDGLKVKFRQRGSGA